MVQETISKKKGGFLQREYIETNKHTIFKLRDRLRNGHNNSSNIMVYPSKNGLTLSPGSLANRVALKPCVQAHNEDVIVFVSVMKLSVRLANGVLN